MKQKETLGTWLASHIIEEAETNITTVVAIYPGRFQPMGKHHAQAYKFLKSSNNKGSFSCIEIAAVVCFENTRTIPLEISESVIQLRTLSVISKSD